MTRAIIDIKTGNGPLYAAGLQMAAYEQAASERQMPINFDPMTHAYRLNGNTVPGVTTVIQSCFPLPADIPEDVMRRAAEFGTAVHVGTSLLDAGTLDRSTVATELEPYLEQWERCKRETGMRIIKNEQRVYSVRHNYAGTLDRVVEWDVKVKRAVIKLTQDDYRVIRCIDPTDFTVFRACLTIYNAKQKEHIL